MEQEPSDVTRQKPSVEIRVNRTEKIINAILIGFMIGIIFYSIVNKSAGVLTLIPVFIALKLFSDSKKNKGKK